MDYIRFYGYQVLNTCSSEISTDLFNTIPFLSLNDHSVIKKEWKYEMLPANS